MSPNHRGPSLWIFYGLYIGLIGGICALAVVSGGEARRPHAFAWDLAALGLSYAVVLTCVVAIFDGIRRLRVIDGEPDASADAPERVPEGAEPIRRIRATV